MAALGFPDSPRHARHQVCIGLENKGADHWKVDVYRNIEGNVACAVIRLVEQWREFGLNAFVIITPLEVGPGKT
jgi:hypothetical protein